MISLSSPSFDVAGILLLRARASNPYQAERRGSVTATLDGGSAVYDSGYSISDTTLNVSLRHPTAAQIVTLQYLVAYYTELTLCCETGAFLTRPQFVVRNDTLSLQLRLLSRLDA